MYMCSIVRCTYYCSIVKLKHMLGQHPLIKRNKEIDLMHGLTERFLAIEHRQMFGNTRLDTDRARLMTILTDPTRKTKGNIFCPKSFLSSQLLCLKFQ